MLLFGCNSSRHSRTAGRPWGRVGSEPVGRWRWWAAGGTIDRRIFHPFCLGFFFLWFNCWIILCIPPEKTKTKKIEKIKKIKKKERKFLGHLNRFDRDRPTRPGSGGSVIFHKGKLIYVRVSVLNRLCAFIPRSFRPRNGTDGDVSRSSTFPPESTWAGVIKWQVVAILETSCDENDVITPPLPSIAICLRADGDDLKFFVAFIWFDFMCLVLN